MKQYLYLLLATLSLNGLHAGGGLRPTPPLPGFRRLVEFKDGNGKASDFLELQMVECEIRTDLLRGLRLLERKEWCSSVRLDYNHITQLSPGIFYGFSRLTRLYLSNNRIEELKEDSLRGLDQLIGLDLTYNEIRAIAPKTFEKTPKLQRLSMDSNRLDQAITLEKAYSLSLPAALSMWSLFNNNLTEQSSSIRRLRTRFPNVHFKLEGEEPHAREKN